MSDPGTKPAARFTDEPEQSRFEAHLGDDVAGFVEYRRRPGLIAFTHTIVEPRFEGHGVGSQLIKAALDEARADGLAVLPFCPFVRSYIAYHPGEYLDLVPREFRAAFDLPSAGT
jgi:predicted GNAT family acetyltransferase